MQQSLVVVQTSEIKSLIEQSVQKAVLNALSKIPRNGDTMRPSQVSQTQAAEMLGLSRGTIIKLIKNGTIKLNQCGMISTKQLDTIVHG